VPNYFLSALPCAWQYVREKSPIVLQPRNIHTGADIAVTVLAEFFCARDVMLDLEQKEKKRKNNSADYAGMDYAGQ